MSSAGFASSEEVSSMALEELFDGEAEADPVEGEIDAEALFEGDEPAAEDSLIDELIDDPEADAEEFQDDTLGPDSVDSVEAEAAEPEPSERENDRIRSLSERATAAEHQVELMNQQMQFQNQQFEQQAAARAQSFEDKLLALQTQIADSQKPRLEDMSPAERYQAETLAKAERAADARYSKRFEAMDGELQRLQQLRDTEARNAKHAKDMRVLEDEVDAVVTKLHAGYSDEHKQALAVSDKTMLMNYAAVNGLRPEAAMEGFVKWKQQIASAEIAQRGRVNKARQAKNKKVPAAGARRASSGPGAAKPPRPSYADIKAAGYENSLEWAAAGSPPVPKRK